MNAAAEAVMKELPDLVMAFGNSDEFRYDNSPYYASSLVKAVFRDRML